MYQIVFTGPESTGKSSLAKALAEHHQVSWVPEYARAYLEKLDRSYEITDLLKIAKGQLEKVESHQSSTDSFLFVDTLMLVMKIWSEYKYDKCDPWILEQLQQNKPDLYVLCDIDVPWQYDEQREHPHLRSELMDIYKNELQKMDVPFIKVNGNLNQRVAKVNKRLQVLR